MPPSRSAPMVSIDVSWDTAALRKIDRDYKQFEQPILTRRAYQALGREMKPLEQELKSAEAASGIRNRSGKHQRSIKLRKAKRRQGEIAAFKIGPSGGTSALLVQGHRVVTRLRRDTGFKARAFPYVEAVIESQSERIIENVGREVWKL